MEVIIGGVQPETAVPVPDLVGLEVPAARMVGHDAGVVATSSDVDE